MILAIRKASFSAPLALLLMLSCVTLPIAGCSTTWVTTVEDILVAAAPALINILNIIAIAKGVPVNLALENKITTDAATVKTLAADFAAASSAAAPTVCAQLQAGISTYAADETQVMSLASVSDPATQTKIETLSALVAGTITGILAVIPACSAVTPASMKALQATSVPVPLKTFVSSYNATLTVPTGNPAVDVFTRSHKVHVHGKFVRMISLGRAY